MGFKDGTINVRPPIEAMDKFVWVGDEGPAWMHGGSYMVVRRIRIALEHWDRMKRRFQEQTIGRHKVSGAPLGKKNEFDPLDLDATDKDGNPVIAENAHVRNVGAADERRRANPAPRLLLQRRRRTSSPSAGRRGARAWNSTPGCCSMCYQHDPRTGFIPIFDKMAAIDMLNQFTTHVGGGLFACPPGVHVGEFIGQALFG